MLPILGLIRETEIVLQEKQNEKQNQPFLQISSPILKMLNRMKKIILAYSFKNLGQYPFNKIDGNFWLFYNDFIPDYPFPELLIGSTPKSFINTYIVKESGENQEFNLCSMQFHLYILTIQNPLSNHN